MSKRRRAWPYYYGVSRDPANLPGLVLWLHGEAGFTVVQGPVTATGTTPPTVTLSGTPNNLSASTVEIDITTPGTRGIALFQWKFDGVVQQTLQVTSASFVLGTTGLQASFSAGTYAANNVYTSVLNVSAWADQSLTNGVANGNNATQATAAVQPAMSSLNGRPAVLFSGTQWLNLPTIAAGAGGILSIAMVCKLTSAPGASTSYTGLSVRSAVTPVTVVDFLNQAGYQNFTTIANVTSSPVATVGFNPTLDTATHVWVLTYNGGGISVAASYAISLDGVVESVVASNNIGIPNTVTGAIGGYVASGPVLTNGCPFTVGEILMSNVTWSAAQMAAISANLIAKWG